MQASTAFGHAAADFVQGMTIAEILALPIAGTVASLIRAHAIVNICAWNGQIGRISRPAIQDLRAVAEAHNRIDLLGAPVIDTLRSTMDMFLDTLALAEPHGALHEGLPDAAEPNMEVAMHLMAIAATPEQRRTVYNEAVHVTLRMNVGLLAEMNPVMQADAPPAVLGDQGFQAERGLMVDHYGETRDRVVAALESLQGMQLTRYRFRTILGEFVTHVLLPLVRAVTDRLATAYHQGMINFAHVHELLDELVHQHLTLTTIVTARLQQHCSDPNVLVKHNPAPIADHPSFNGAQLAARIQEARDEVDDLRTVYHEELEAAFAAGPIVHLIHAAEAIAHAAAMAGMQAELPNPADMQVMVDGIMAQATVVHLLEEDDCAACMMPTHEMVLCHGCQRCHCCVACTRHIVQTNPLGHRCPVCRSRAFPAPGHAQQ